MKKRLLLSLFIVVFGSIIFHLFIEASSSFGNNSRRTNINLQNIPLLHSVNEYYLSPLGDDRIGKGTKKNPWHSLNRAWEEVKAGDIVYMKGGTYHYKKSQILSLKDGKPGSPITVKAVSGEYPVISPHSDFNETRGIDIQGDYIHFKGLEITGFIQRKASAFYYGIVAENSNHLIFEGLKVHDNGFGLSIGSDSGDNLVLNSDFYRNADPQTSFGRNKPWGGADGITIRSSDSSKTNTIRGCRMWWNSDDGIDLFENQGMVIIEHCWSFWNGYQPGTFKPAGDGDGYKLGVTASDQSDYERRLLRYNLSFENKARGFDQNNARCITLLYNNTSYNNANRGKAARSYDFWNGEAATVAKNNIDFNPTLSVAFNDQAIISHNTFQKDGSDNSSYSVGKDDFLSLDSKGADGPRQKDGSLPHLKFLKLKKGSDLIDAGTDIGLPYKGKAPDLGAYESDY
jgi:hypothetical protein